MCRVDKSGTRGKDLGLAQMVRVHPPWIMNALSGFTGTPDFRLRDLL